MADHDFYKHILDIQTPWKVLDVTIDQPKKQLDIYLGFAGTVKRSVFGFILKKGSTGGGGKQSCPHCNTVVPNNNGFKIIRVRHLPVAGFVTFLHVPAPGSVQSSRSDCICMRSWIAAGTSCTVEMRDYVLALLQVISNDRDVVRLTGITENELRDIQKAGGGAVAGSAKNVGAQISVAATDDDLIPKVEDQVWQRLIRGELSFRSNTVAFNMLLQRLRQNYAASPGSETGTAGAALLRQFFSRNMRVMKPEIDQLVNRRSGTGGSGDEQPSTTDKNMSAASAKSDGIPAADDPVWQLLINGDLFLHSNAVALKMLMQRARLEYIKSPGNEARVAGAKLLRQYFLRHQKSLKNELDQLNNRHSVAAPKDVEVKFTAGNDKLPAESAAVWKRIVTGDQQLQTSMVGLQMILERTRGSLQRDPSTPNLQVCVHTLRSFFIKYQGRLGQEIVQLGQNKEATSV